MKIYQVGGIIVVDYHLGGLVSFINCLAGVNRGSGEDEEKGKTIKIHDCILEEYLKKFLFCVSMLQRYSSLLMLLWLWS